MRTMEDPFMVQDFSPADRLRRMSNNVLGIFLWPDRYGTQLEQDARAREVEMRARVEDLLSRTALPPALESGQS